MKRLVYCLFASGLPVILAVGPAIAFMLSADPALARTEPNSVPEPGTLSLLSAGAAGIIATLIRKKFRKRK